MKDQTHLWAREYDRELTNLLALQGEVAGEVAGEVQRTLRNHQRIEPGPQRTLSPESYQAHELYLKGRYFGIKG